MILARAVLEATCKDKGASGKDLYKRIDALHSAGLINELVKDEAHEVRLMGIDMAHGDLGTPVTESEAEEILALMGEVWRRFIRDRLASPPGEQPVKRRREVSQRQRRDIGSVSFSAGPVGRYGASPARGEKTQLDTIWS